MEPWLSPHSYWLPKHYVVSAWLAHAPFAFWLMAAARPKVVVELGTHTGFSFFVFAEAAKRLGLDTQLYAVDSWEGDIHSGFYSEDVYDSVRAISQIDYPDLTHLVRGYFNESVDKFDDGSIDLLHIDGRHRYDDVVEDFNLYRPKLSDNAVVLFHDTFEFNDDFGVHQFWAEISATRPSFNFEHGHGLGVLAYGSQVPTAISSFLELANAQPDRVRENYYDLGENVMRQFAAIETLENFRLEALQAGSLIPALRAEIEDLRLSTDEKLQQLEEMRQELDETRREIDQKRRGIDEIKQQMEEMRLSSSWRATAPLRAMSARLRSRI